MEYFLEFFAAVTGEEIDSAELLKRGERVWNLQKLLNVRLGFRREHDRAPQAWFEPLKIGEGELHLMDYYKKGRISREDTEKMLDDYYQERGWDIKTGAPSAVKLKELGLENFAV